MAQGRERKQKSDVGDIAWVVLQGNGRGVNENQFPFFFFYHANQDLTILVPIWLRGRKSWVINFGFPMVFSWLLVLCGG